MNEGWSEARDDVSSIPDNRKAVMSIPDDQQATDVFF
jgi:hypothetical protein